MPDRLDRHTEGDMKRRSLLQSAAFATLGVGDARAQVGGTPVRIIFPFPAGGSGDALARLTAEIVRGELGQPVIVDNKPGAGGRLGIKLAKAAPPDGKTLLVSPIAPMAVYQHVYAALEYDPLGDFRAVAQLATFDFAVAVASDIPARSVPELIAWLKANPDRANYGSPAAGTLPHFLGGLFARAASVELRHIAYGATARPVNDLVGGHIPMVFYSTNELVELHRAGRIRVLATSGTDRSPFLPDVPTFREAGYDIQATGWHGAFAPAGIPDANVDRLNRAIVAGLQAPQGREKVTALGLQPASLSAAAFAAVQRSDAALWASAIKLSGFKPEQ
jgi:tripartite-type tricarboxylate transporter receptor subunit TctC